MDDFLGNFASKFEEVLSDVFVIKRDKSDKTDAAAQDIRIKEAIEAFDVKLDELSSKQLTLEHYSERYIPV